MRVFAVFSEEKAGLVKAWVDSWSARGWTPKLISPREVRLCGSVAEALRQRKGSVLSDLRAINFSARAPARGRSVGFGRRGWKTAEIVRFSSGDTEQTVRQCGRDLSLA